MAILQTWSNQSNFILHGQNTIRVFVVCATATWGGAALTLHWVASTSKIDRLHHTYQEMNSNAILYLLCATESFNRSPMALVSQWYPDTQEIQVRTLAILRWSNVHITALTCTLYWCRFHYLTGLWPDGCEGQSYPEWHSAKQFCKKTWRKVHLADCLARLEQLSSLSRYSTASTSIVTQGNKCKLILKLMHQKHR